MLETCIHQVRSGRSVVVEIVGEAGIGKTALLGQLLDRADQAGFPCLWATASAAETDVPFAMLDALISDLMPHLGELSARDRHDLARLTSLLPALGSLADPTESEPHVSMLEISAALARVMAGLARRRGGLVVAVDDMQWSDDASRMIIESIARRTASAPLLIATFSRKTRITGADTAPPSASGQALLVQLRALDASEAAELLTEVEPLARQSIIDLAGGNPLFLTELAIAARSGHNTGQVMPARAGSSYPAAVEASILARLARLTPAEQSLVKVAAVLRSPFPADIAERVVGVGQSPTPSLDALEGDFLHLVDEDLHTFGFRYPLVERVVGESMGFSERRQIHARAAKVLADAGAKATVVAHHLGQSAEVGDTDAARAISAAGIELMRFSPSSAASLFANASRILPADARVQQSETMALQASALYAAGRIAEAQAVLMTALVGVPPDEFRLRAALLALVAKVETHLDVATVTAQVPWEFAELPQSAAEERTWLAVVMLNDAGRRRDVERMRAAEQEAARWAATSGNPYLVLVISSLCANWESIAGDPALADHHLSEGIDAVSGVPDEELHWMLDHLVLLAGVAGALARDYEAFSLARRAVKFTRMTGNFPMLAWSLLTLGASLLELGQLSAARRAFSDTRELAEMLGNDVLSGAACSGLARLAALTGHSAEVDALVPRFHQSEDSTLTLLGGMSALTCVIALIEDGRTVDAHTLLIDSNIATNDFATGHAGRALLYSTLCRISADMGQLEESRSWAHKCSDFADRTQLPQHRALAFRARTVVALAAQDHVAALEFATSALAMIPLRGWPILAVELRGLRAKALVLSGRTDEALQAYGEAGRAATALGAVSIASRIDAELQRLGAHPDHSIPLGASAGPVDLTPREAEIAGLVARGMSNRETANLMFVSKRTVESHLVRIYRKLGVSSRQELSSALERQQDLSAFAVDL